MMEQKTKVRAEDGKQELVITREFDLPLELLFQAYAAPELLEQWMGTKVLKLESKQHGSYRFETTDARGKTYGFSGVIHEFSPSQRITRTFEFEDMPFGVQLEFLTFEQLTGNTSKLTIRSIYESVTHRNQMLQTGLAHGLSMAHNRLQSIVSNLQ